MRGAASPISPSRTRDRSRTNSAKPSATASMAATIASRSCPWNKFAQEGREAKLAARDELRAPALAELARLDDAAFRALFTKSPVKRIGRDRFLRNVLIAIGNSGDAALADEAERLLDDASALVRGAAVWALAVLPGELARDANADAASETSVREEWEPHLTPCHAAERHGPAASNAASHVLARCTVARPRRFPSKSARHDKQPFFTRDGDTFIRRKSPTARGIRNRCTDASSSACSASPSRSAIAPRIRAGAADRRHVSAADHRQADRGDDTAGARRDAHPRGRGGVLLRRRQHGARLVPAVAADAKSRRQCLVAAELGRAEAGRHSRADRSQARHERQMDDAPDRRRRWARSVRAGSG